MGYLEFFYFDFEWYVFFIEFLKLPLQWCIFSLNSLQFSWITLCCFSLLGYWAIGSVWFVWDRCWNQEIVEHLLCGLDFKIIIIWKNYSSTKTEIPKINKHIPNVPFSLNKIKTLNLLLLVHDAKINGVPFFCSVSVNMQKILKLWKMTLKIS